MLGIKRAYLEQKSFPEYLKERYKVLIESTAKNTCPTALIMQLLGLFFFLALLSFLFLLSHFCFVGDDCETRPSKLFQVTSETAWPWVVIHDSALGSLLPETHAQVTHIHTRFHKSLECDDEEDDDEEDSSALGTKRGPQKPPQTRPDTRNCVSPRLESREPN